MLREQVKVGATVLFGRPKGEKTLGVVISIGPKKAKVKTLEGRGQNDSAGMIWGVPFSLMQPATGQEAVPAQTGVPDAILRVRVENLIATHGVDAVLGAIKAITGREAA